MLKLQSEQSVNSNMSPDDDLCTIKHQGFEHDAASFRTCLASQPLDIFREIARSLPSMVLAMDSCISLIEDLNMEGHLLQCLLCCCPLLRIGAHTCFKNAAELCDLHLNLLSLMTDSSARLPPERCAVYKCTALL